MPQANQRDGSTDGGSMSEIINDLQIAMRQDYRSVTKLCRDLRCSRTSLNNIIRGKLKVGPRLGTVEALADELGWQLVLVRKGKT